jgi:putative ABC transport system ATP-binding protein
MIEIRDITKIYRKRSVDYTALNKVSLNIKQGDFIVVDGPSGAGKSTLLNVTGGLIHPDSGEVLFNGMNIYNQDNRTQAMYRKNHAGFIFQQFHLVPFLTVFENIRLSCHSAQQVAQISSYLEKCSLSALKDKYPSELSVGEKQRTAFIRAIIPGPDILLADEPTGNLDPANSKILMSLAEDYHHNGGTVILVSHDPLALKYATRSITLNNGTVVY